MDGERARPSWAPVFAHKLANPLGCRPGRHERNEAAVCSVIVQRRLSARSRFPPTSAWTPPAEAVPPAPVDRQTRTPPTCAHAHPRVRRLRLLQEGRQNAFVQHRNTGTQEPCNDRRQRRLPRATQQLPALHLRGHCGVNPLSHRMPAVQMHDSPPHMQVIRPRHRTNPRLAVPSALLTPCKGAAAGGTPAKNTPRPMASPRHCAA